MKKAGTMILFTAILALLVFCIPVPVRGVEAPIQIAVHPADFVGNVGEMAVFRVDALGSDLQFQWFYSNNGGKSWSRSTASGAQKDRLSIPITAARLGQMYRCKISNGRGAELTTRGAKILAVGTPLAIVEQPRDFTGDLGETASFHVGAEGDTLCYRWEYSNNGGRSWSESTLTGAKTDTLTVTLLSHRVGQLYRCVVTDGTGETVTSQQAKIDLRQEPVKILQQPADFQGVYGDTATFHVAASGRELSYQWSYSNNGGKNWSESTLTGAKTDTLTVTLLAHREGQLYRCVVTDGSGAEVISQWAKLTGREKEFRIVQQPTDVTGKEGQTAAFHVEVGGTPVAYQWYYSNNGGKKWNPSSLQGAKTATLSVAITTRRDGQMYYCQIRDGSGKVLSSKIVTLSIAASNKKSAGQAIAPVVSFVDDDGRVEAYTVLYPWMQQYRVPYTFAISSQNIGINKNFANAQQLRTMIANPLVTFSCHCLKNTDMNTKTPEEMEQILRTWFGEMQAYGLTWAEKMPSTYMYCRGLYDDTVIAETVSRYFKAGFTTAKGINTTPFDSFHMNRVGLFPTTGGFSLENAKAYVDEVCAKGGWLIFFTHCYYDSFDLDGLTELVTYIRQKGVEIRSVEDVLRRYGNREDSGIFNKKKPGQAYSVTDYLGNVYSSAGPVEFDFTGIPTPYPGN